MEGVGRAGKEELLDPDGETVQREEELLDAEDLTGGGAMRRPGPGSGSL